MMNPRRLFGNHGEDVAADYLEQKGYEILVRQYRSSFGEVDLVCRMDNLYVFVEVKSRNSQAYGYPEESVTKVKRQHLQRVSEAYLTEHHLFDVDWRVDVIALEFDQDPPNITHFEAIDA